LTLFALYTETFEGASREVFDADLDRKDLALLIEDGDSHVGFTTVQVTASSFRGQPLRVLYSGDTVLRKEYWGTTALPRAWISLALSIRGGAETPLYWLLLAGSFRTYKFLPLFFSSFYPRYGVCPPPAVREMADALAEERFGDRYDRVTGVVTFPGAPRLRKGVADLTPSCLMDSDTAYFVARNPGYAGGDELVCLCELSETNLTRAGRRMLR